MKVTASTEAMSYVLERGGKVYLWTEPVGGAWMGDHVGTEPPDDVTFDLVSRKVIEVYVEHGLKRPKELTVDLRERPRRGLKVHWGDEVWGARGEGAPGAGAMGSF